MNENKEYYNTDLQLLYIMPIQCYNLLPINIQPFMYDLSKGCLHYYPSSFKIQTYLFTYLHECSPILPDINLENLITKIT